MPSYAEVYVAQTAGLVQFNGGGTNYLVQTPSNVWYFVYVDSGSDIAFVKSTNLGLTWSNPTVIFTGTATGLSVWYDRWSDISAGLIHCAYTESVSDDTLYRTIDTESSDALSTQTVIFAGSSAVAGGSLSITRARGGNVYCRTNIDLGAEGGFYRLPNANVPSGAWDAARTINETLASGDQMILVPGFAADNQDIIGLFWDASANEISRQLHDDSGNSWAETSIATSMNEQVVTTAFPHFSAAVDIANSRIILVAWSNIDTSGSDLRCWTITESSITEVTNVITDSTDDQGLAAISIDTNTGYWYVYYVGKSDGSETFLTSVNIYYKVSKDEGTTWGPETKLTNSTYDITWISACPRFFNQPIVAFHKDVALDQLNVCVPITRSRPTLMLGI